MDKLTHLDEQGRARMVDVSNKQDTLREAVARGSVIMKRQTLDLILNQQIIKGDVLSVAQIAGIMAAKKTSEIIPLCHPLPISSVEVQFKPDIQKSLIDIEVKAKTVGKTGVEMEALVGVSVAALTIYDMCKAVDKEMTISEIQLISKTGGKSGTFVRDKEN